MRAPLDECERVVGALTTTWWENLDFFGDFRPKNQGFPGKVTIR
jgi:hypothetical protein